MNITERMSRRAKTVVARSIRTRAVRNDDAAVGSNERLCSVYSRSSVMVIYSSGRSTFTWSLG